MRRRALLFQGETDYSQQYLTFEALESGTFSLVVPSGITSTHITGGVSYSIDNGATWSTTAITNSAQTITTPTIPAGGKVLWKAVARQLGTSSSYCNFQATGNFDVSGNIMSLEYGDDFVGQTALKDYTYSMYDLFSENTKVISAENLILPATTLTSNCYSYMFYNCSSLTKAPAVLPATTLTYYCYGGMFYGCTSLTTAPELPATTLASYCYYNMFYNCNPLTTAPELPATTLASNCYKLMFYNCSSLSYIKCNAQECPSTVTFSTCFYNWVRGVSTDGRLYFNPKLYWTTGDSGMPVSWDTYTIEDATQDYFTLIAGSSGTFTFHIPSFVTTTHITSISYSLDDGATWTTTNNSSSSNTVVTVTTPTVEAYSRVLWKGSGNTMYKDYNYYCTFSATMGFCVAGNIMSLLHLDNFLTRKSLSTSYCFYGLFNNNTKLVNAAGLMLPATSLLTGCYSNMFNGCTSLTKAPVLPATTLVSACYNRLFYGCTRLKYIKAMFTTTPAYSYNQLWVSGVASSGTFVKNSAATWTLTGDNGAPSGWTVRTASS